MCRCSPRTCQKAWDRRVSDWVLASKKWEMQFQLHFLLRQNKDAVRQVDPDPVAWQEISEKSQEHWQNLSVTVDIFLYWTLKLLSPHFPVFEANCTLHHLNLNVVCSDTLTGWCLGVDSDWSGFLFLQRRWSYRWLLLWVDLSGLPTYSSLAYVAWCSIGQYRVVNSWVRIISILCNMRRMASTFSMHTYKAKPDKVSKKGRRNP